MTSTNHSAATITPPKKTNGKSGRFGSEQVAAFSRNRWPFSSECAYDVIPGTDHFFSKDMDTLNSLVGNYLDKSFSDKTA